MSEVNPPVVVIFRKWKDDGSIIALFPEELADRTRYACLSYMHVGQHAAADYGICTTRTTPATPDEYKPLKQELESIGYTLKIRTRYTRRSK